MANDGTVKIGTELDKSGLSKGLSGLGGFAKKGFSVIGSTAAGAAKIATGAIAAVGTSLAGLGAAGVKYNASIQQYETSFEVMTGSAEKAAQVIDELKKVGAATPFELPELADTTQLLMNYGFTADEAMDKMMMLGDISQGSADKMSRIAMAYGQMSSAGKVSLEDVKQMIEAGFNPLQEISESTGESMDSLYDRISKGTISVDEITASMQRATSEGGKYYKSMEKQSQTINGMISTLKDNAQQLLGEVVQPITESVGSTLLPAAIDAVEQLTEAFKTGGTEGLIGAGTQILTDVLLGIANGLPGLINTASQIILSLIENLNLNMPQIMNAGISIFQSLASGIMQLLPALGMLAWNIITTLATGLMDNLPQIAQQGQTLFTNFCDVIRTRLPELIQSGMQMVTSLLHGLLNHAPQIIGQAGAMMTEFIGALLSALPDILQSGAEMIGSLLSGLIKNAPQIIGQAGKMLADYLFEVASHLPEILQSGIEIIGELLAGLIKAIPNLIASIPGMIADIANAFLEKDWASVGWNILEGIKNGIMNAAGGLVDAAVSAAENAIETVKGWLGIHSPSKRARDEIGVNMIAGVSEGVEEETPNLEKASVKSVGRTVDAMKKTAAADFVLAMQEKSYRAADNNEIAAREKYRNNGYEPDEPDDDPSVVVNNTFHVDGKELVNETVKKTKKEISKEQKKRTQSKGGVHNGKLVYC